MQDDHSAPDPAQPLPPGPGVPGWASNPSPRIVAAFLLERRDLPEADRRAVARVIGWRRIPADDVVMIGMIARRLHEAVKARKAAEG